jgi:hypothetical protein
MADEWKCPRRGENPGPWSFLPEYDAWAGGRCSYCGSLNPGEFMRRAEIGERLIPTDKNYKVYIGATEKFYFQHLSIEQRKAFIDLLNSRKLSIGEPGHFYVLPFFMQRAASPPGEAG